MPDALSPETVQRLNESSDRLYDEFTAATPGAAGSNAGTLGLFRSVSRDDEILDLVDHPSTFPLLCEHTRNLPVACDIFSNKLRIH